MLREYLDELAFESGVAGWIVHDLWASGKLHDRGLDNSIDQWSEEDIVDWLKDLVTEVKTVLSR